MRDILTITGPIYLVIAPGYLATRFGLFDKPAMRTLGQFVLNLALPALLFRAIARREAADLLHGDYLLAYAAGSVGRLGLGWCVYRFALHQRAAPSAVVSIGVGKLMLHPLAVFLASLALAFLPPSGHTLVC